MIFDYESRVITEYWRPF